MENRSSAPDIYSWNSSDLEIGSLYHLAGNVYVRVAGFLHALWNMLRRHKFTFWNQTEKHTVYYSPGVPSAQVVIV